MHSPPTDPYDAVLLLSFGGPEGPDDVMPFLENVTRGRDVPRDRLLEVARHYFDVGGVSPINEQNRALLAAIERDLAANDVDVPVYWGNRNWSPYVSDTLAKMRADGIQRAAVFVTSAYASYSGCRQYREDLAAGAEAAGGAPRLDKLRHYFNHPGFVDAIVDATVDAIGELPLAVLAGARLAFVTHSIPVAMAETSGPEGGAYEAQHNDVARLVADRVAGRVGINVPWTLAYCSRSGPSAQPWLEPDINDHLRAISADGASAVVVIPIGFISDHMEVRYDLDTEATRTAEQLGLPSVRAQTAGIDHRFVAMVRDLLLERAAVCRGDQPARATVGSLGPSHDVCPVGCCRNLRGERPALAGAEVDS